MGWKDWSYAKRGIVGGGIIGIILVIINTFIAGVPGMILFGWFLRPFVEMTNCAGEDCWGTYALFGNIVFFIIGLLIGAIIGKIKSRN